MIFLLIVYGQVIAVKRPSLKVKMQLLPLLPLTVIALVKPDEPSEDLYPGGLIVSEKTKSVPLCSGISIRNNTSVNN